jgi:hypothetical protein
MIPYFKSCIILKVVFSSGLLSALPCQVDDQPPVGHSGAAAMLLKSCAHLIYNFRTKLYTNNHEMEYGNKGIREIRDLFLKPSY